MRKRKLNGTCDSCGSPAWRRQCLACYFKARAQDTRKERLLSKVEKSRDGCWMFNGFRLANGYGRIKGDGESVMLAHRMSWEVFKGPIPEGLLVLHRCDTRPCVNPDHLFLGTHRDNMLDMISKGRRVAASIQPKTRGHKHWNTKLTLPEVKKLKRASHEKRSALAEKLGISRRYANAIACGAKWKWVRI